MIFGSESILFHILAASLSVAQVSQVSTSLRKRWLLVLYRFIPFLCHLLFLASIFGLILCLCDLPGLELEGPQSGARHIGSIDGIVIEVNPREENAYNSGYLHTTRGAPFGVS